MKKILIATGLLVSLNVSVVHAGWWEETKDFASDAWQTTKETAIDLKDQAVDSWEEVGSSNDSPDGGQLSDIKKLAEKETYVQAWEDIKESAKNPSEAQSDENGIPVED